MKKKIIVLLLLFISLFIITGCQKGVKTTDEKTGKSRTEYVCKKVGIERENTVGEKYKYTVDVTNTAKLDDDGNLIYYSTLSHYTIPTVDQCNDSCEVAKEWNDEINAKNYKGGHRVTTCNCDKKEYSQEQVYDDIANLDSILRSDISELKEDNSFDLDAWISRYEKVGYTCN